MKIENYGLRIIHNNNLRLHPKANLLPIISIPVFQYLFKTLSVFHFLQSPEAMIISSDNTNTIA